MLKGIIVMSKVENICIRKVVKTGTSKTISVPKNWAEIGESVVVTVKDADTLIVSKSLHR